MIIEKLNFISFLNLLKMLILAFENAEEKLLMEQIAKVFAVIEENEIFKDEKFKEIILDLSKKVNNFAVNPKNLEFKDSLMNDLDSLTAKYE